MQWFHLCYKSCVILTLHTAVMLIYYLLSCLFPLTGNKPATVEQLNTEMNYEMQRYSDVEVDKPRNGKHPVSMFHNADETAFASLSDKPCVCQRTTW